MRLDVGPVPSESVLSWVDYAAGVIASRGGEDLPVDVVEGFRWYLLEWRREAERGPEFHWEAEVSPEVAEYLMLPFFRTAERLSTIAVQRRRPAAPPESTAFYVLLVQAVLDALEQEGPAQAEFADHLRSFWPGLGQV